MFISIFTIPSSSTYPHSRKLSFKPNSNIAILIVSSLPVCFPFESDSLIVGYELIPAYGLFGAVATTLSGMFALTILADLFFNRKNAIAIFTCYNHCCSFGRPRLGTSWKKPSRALFQSRESSYPRASTLWKTCACCA